MPAFERGEYQSRLGRTRAAMERQKIDALLVTKPPNLYYLTGARSAGGFAFQAAIITPERDPVFLTRRNDEGTVRTWAWVDDVRSYRDTEDPFSLLRQTLVASGLAGKTIGLEVDTLTYPRHQRLVQVLDDCRIADASDLVEELRLIKSPQELAYMRRSAQLCDIGMAAGIAVMRDGAWEYEVAAAVLHAQYLSGQDDDAAVVLIGSGPHSALGHNSYRNKQMRAGEQVSLEVGGCWELYGTNALRTVFLGAADERWLRIYQLVLRSYREAFAAVKPGVPAGRIDDIAHRVFEEAGYGDYFTRRVGFSIGIFTQPELWIEPKLNLLRGVERPLEPGMTMSIEPGFYWYGMGGIKIGDNFVVTDGGFEYLTTPHHEVLTK